MYRGMRQLCLPLILAFFFALFGAGMLLKVRGEAVFAQGEVLGATVKKTEFDELLFSDYTKTKLNEEFSNSEALGALEKTASDAGAKASFARARDVLCGNVRFEAEREFSTREGAENALEQFGDLGLYAKNELQFYYRTADTIITEICAAENDEIKVYVEADAGAKLPALVACKISGTYQTYRREFSLSEGENLFRLSGEMVYLKNPYEKATQRGDVSVYIEGGVRYPVYRSGESEGAFLGYLKEYEEQIGRDPSTPDVAEIVTQGGIFTLPATILCQTYLEEKTITPGENARLWGEFFRAAFEFNGVPLSEDSKYSQYFDERNRALKINYRLMDFSASWGAYATDYHIGYKDQAPWFADFNLFQRKNVTNLYLFNMCHELGHVLDVKRKALPETTNNVTGTYLYLNVLSRPADKGLQPFEKALSYLASDYKEQGKAYDDGYVLYKTAANYDHNYLAFWELECVFPGYWGRVNNYFRYQDTFRSSNAGRQNVEKLVYYSSLATGADLKEYFDRWGVYLTTDFSDLFSLKTCTLSLKEALEKAQKDGLISAPKKYWYADSEEYRFMLGHLDEANKSFRGKTPKIVSVRKSEGKNVLKIQSEKDPDHLGYEVFSSQNGEPYQAAGFTYSDCFRDDNVYSGAVSYKVYAYNRYFSKSKGSEAIGGAAQGGAKGVCRVKGETFGTLAAGLSAAGSGDEVELLDDCMIKEITIVKDLTIKVADEVTGDVTIFADFEKPSYFFHIYGAGNHVSFEGRKDARLILNGFFGSFSYPALWLGEGLSFSARYLTVCNYSSVYLGGGLYSDGAEISLYQCNFENCRGAKNGDGVTMEKSSALSMEDCAFSGQTTDLCFNAPTELSFKGEIGAMKVGFGNFDGGVFLVCENKAEAAQKISFSSADFTFKETNGALEMGRAVFCLTFQNGSRKETVTVRNSVFTFGEENLSVFQKQYCKTYRDGAGNVYSRGDKLTLRSDMTFTVTLENSSCIALQFFGKRTEYYFAEDAALYLPRFDGGKKIVSYRSPYQSYPAGSVFRTQRKGEDLLIAVYEGYYSFSATVLGGTQSVSYFKYGEKVVLPTVEEENFLGWYAQGALYRGGETCELLRDMAFTAVFEGEKIDLSKAEIVVFDCSFTGKAQEPTVFVLLDGTVLSSDLYTVSFRDNTGPGTAYVKISPACGYAAGEKEETFTIAGKTDDPNGSESEQPPKEEEGKDPDFSEEEDGKEPELPKEQEKEEEKPEGGGTPSEGELGGSGETEKSGGNGLYWLFAIPAALLIGTAAVLIVAFKKKKR